MFSCWCELSLLNADNTSFCVSVRTTGVLSKAKNSDNVILNALQIFISDGTVGVIPLLNHDEIVVCAIPDSSDNRYSVQFLSRRSSQILSNTFIKTVSPYIILIFIVIFYTIMY